MMLHVITYRRVQSFDYNVELFITITNIIPVCGAEHNNLEFWRYVDSGHVPPHALINKVHIGDIHNMSLSVSARLIIEAINKPVVGHVINFIEPKEVHERILFTWIAFGKEYIMRITLAGEAYLERLFKSIP